MAVYKRNNKWGVDIVYPDSRRYKRLIGTKKQANAVETNLKKEILEMKYQVRFLEEITFKDFYEKYRDYIEQNQSESTYKNNQFRIEKNILPFFKKTPLVFISKEKIDEYKQKRLKEDVAPNTIRNELSCLSHIFKMAIRWGNLFVNPVHGVEKPRKAKQPPRFLTQEQEEKLLANCEPHLYPIVLTALNTGLRKGELLNLKWSDVNLDNRELAVQSKYDWHTKNYLYRFIGINDKLFKVLSKLPRANEYVFTYAGQRIKNIKRSITTAYKKAGIDHQGQPLHILRHTFATRLIEKGTPLEKIQKLLGHADFSTTLQYAHLTSRSVKDEVKKLD